MCWVKGVVAVKKRAGAGSFTPSFSPGTGCLCITAVPE
jgi:hypothetical protein